MSITSLYFTWLISSMGETFGIFGGAGIIASLFYVIAYAISESQKYEDQPTGERFKKIGKILLVFTIISVSLATVVPNKKDMAMIAGMHVVTNDPTVLKGKEVLNTVMDRYLKEDK